MKMRASALLLMLGFLAPCRTTAAQTSCPPPDTAASWVRASRLWSNERGLRWRNDSLRRVLLAMGEEDQGARAEFGARTVDSLYVRRLTQLDSSLAARLNVILDRFGLPTRDMVGPAGSDAAMLIVQHNWPLQQRVLALSAMLPPNQISPEKLAMLEDRVLVHQGKPQRFGTQFTLGTDNVFRFAPIADTVRLDDRRAAAGMPPLSQYVCLLEEAGMHVDRASLPQSFRP